MIEAEIRTKSGKEEYANFLAKADGKEVISQETMDTLEAMRIALYATPFVKKLIYGKHEESFFWTDEETGVECKCRPDSYGEISGQALKAGSYPAICLNMHQFSRLILRHAP